MLLIVNLSKLFGFKAITFEQNFKPHFINYLLKGKLRNETKVLYKIPKRNGFALVY